MKIKINESYKPLYTTKKRYILVTGGRGSLKSTTVHDFIVRLTYEQGHGILFTRFTMASAETSIIPEFLNTIDKLGVRDQFTITKTKLINNITQSFILFSGIKTSSGDQTAKLKSLSGITTWVIEEMEDFTDIKSFQDIQQSIRSANMQNRIIMIMNPTTVEHFVYSKFILKSNEKRKVQGYDVTVSNHKNVEHIHTTYHLAQDLGYLNSDWIEEAEESKLNNADYYFHNYIGGWLERKAGCIFTNWIEGEFDETLASVYGLDWGFFPDPLAMIRVAVDSTKRIIYLDECIYKTNVVDVEKELLIASNKRSLIVCDTSENRTRQTLYDNGFNIENTIKNKIIDDIREICNYKLVITKKSVNLKIELNNYVWNDSKNSVPIDKYNHLLDAMRYAFNRLMRVKSDFIIGTDNIF